MNDKLAILRNMLWQMEVEVGLEQLSQAQRDVYYAACLVADDDQLVHSDIVKGVSTFQQASDAFAALIRSAQGVR